MNSNNKLIVVNIAEQSLSLFNNQQLIMEFSVATALKGAGERRGSEQTPRGWHQIRARIGEHNPINTVFIGRRPTGEIYSPQLRSIYPHRDWILTRILWLSGLEKGRNRFGEVDTMARYIYIHGCPDDEPVGIPNSHGCIRMRNQELIKFFDNVSVGTKINIIEK